MRGLGPPVLAAGRSGACRSGSLGLGVWWRIVGGVGGEGEVGVGVGEMCVCVYELMM